MLRLLRVFAGVSMIAVVLACSRPREDSGYGSGAEGAAKQDVVKQTVPVGYSRIPSSANQLHFRNQARSISTRRHCRIRSRPSNPTGIILPGTASLP